MQVILLRDTREHSSTPMAVMSVYIADDNYVVPANIILDMCSKGYKLDIIPAPIMCKGSSLENDLKQDTQKWERYEK